MGIVLKLGEVCGELRREAKINLSRIAYHLGGGKGKDSRALVRFEKGETTPHFLDKVLDAYAYELEIPVVRLSEMAVARQKADDAPTKIERALTDVARSTRKARAGTARKRDARRK